MTPTASCPMRTMTSSDIELRPQARGKLALTSDLRRFIYSRNPSDLFRETIIARNVYAAWARKLTTAKPTSDPDLSKHPLKSPNQEPDRIILREKNKTIVSPKKQEEKKAGSGSSPPLFLPRKGRKGAKQNRRLGRLRSPKQLVRKFALPRSTPPRANLLPRLLYSATFGRTGRRGNGYS
ncbi:hypothetical protein TNCV_432491 [Trichonephila clavipes]|nr:hypothetical protein TNCV_432491 [Trichonephila clavipes]